MLDCHLNAWLCKPLKIFGRQMLPLTVGHAYLLEAVGSPFMVGGSIKLSDICLAALICSKPFQHTVKILLDNPAVLIRRAEWWGFMVRLRKLELDDETKKFRNYIDAYSTFMEEWKDTNRKRSEIATPMSIMLAWMLMQTMSEEKAWNMPLVRALAYYGCEAEKNGTEFLTENQKKIRDGNGDSDIKN